MNAVTSQSVYLRCDFLPFEELRRHGACLAYSFNRKQQTSPNLTIGRALAHGTAQKRSPNATGLTVAARPGRRRDQAA